MKYSTFLQQNCRIQQNVSECWASKSSKISVPKTRRHNAPKQYNNSPMKDLYWKINNNQYISEENALKLPNL